VGARVPGGARHRPDLSPGLRAGRAAARLDRRRGLRGRIRARGFGDRYLPPAGTQIQTHKPSTTIVAHGPYAVTRNPIYLGMVLGQVGLAIGFDSLWILIMLVPFSFVLRHGVIAREEAYLERKFGRVYLDYKSRTRRWI